MSKLKAWLRPNLLTKEDLNDYTATPLSAGSLNINDIVQDLAKEGMEIKLETALDIISRFQRKVSERVVEGYAVNTGLVLMKPAIKGVFYDKNWDKDKHAVYININQGAELRKAIAQTSVEILGIQADPIAILGITDKASGKTDGSLTKGKNTEIKGTYIKIVGEHPDNGIYFTNTENKKKIKVEASDIVINEPSRLLILVPNNLSPGTYELSVTTQFSTNTTLLKQPRSFVWDTPITIA